MDLIFYLDKPQSNILLEPSFLPTSFATQTDAHTARIL